DSPELPAFGNSMSEPISADGVNLIELLTQQRQSVEPTEATPDTDDDETEIDSLAEDIWGSGETAGEDVADVTDAIEDFPATVEELEEKESPDSQSDRSTMIPAFQGGKQGDRFLSRLSALVGDSELVEWMKIDSIEPTVETPPEETVDETSGDEVQEEIDWEAREIVVDDEPVPPIPGTFFSLGGSKQPLSGPGGNLARLSGREELAPTGDLYDSNNSTSGYILPPDEPVPVPEVEILDREVVAGRRVKIRVQLPDLLARIYVKLWISDRQTQTIVDHPRWVTDFSLNGFDKLEAMVEMKVPFGCMEVRFEAIAREMQTNRESHKASIDRQVAPPPPPSLPLEN
ncbi:MAG: hypothetical protein F6K35_49300, partial [Okeania sp. SIO2H7]|nr:hypothetical protein [Okeania sp. SIO2H7]